LLISFWASGHLFPIARSGREILVRFAQRRLLHEDRSNPHAARDCVVRDAINVLGGAITVSEKTPR